MGYREKSKFDTRFRIRATNVLRGHLVRGFTLNEKRLWEPNQKLADLRRTVGLLEKTLAHEATGPYEPNSLIIEQASPYTCEQFIGYALSMRFTNSLAILALSMCMMLSGHIELFKQFCDNPGFKKWLSDTAFDVTYQT